MVGTILCLVNLILYIVQTCESVDVTVPESIIGFTTHTTVLQCTYSTTGGNPIVNWYKGSSTATGTLVIQSVGGVNYPDMTRHDIQDQASLVITNTMMSDAGMYWCSVSAFPDGSDEDSVTLTVEVATEPSQPSITFIDGSIISNAGSKITMQCTSSGNPTPIYSWLRDGSPLPTLNRYQLNTDNSELTINPSNRGDNGRIFTCQVMNFKGSKTEDKTLTIRYPPDDPVCTYQSTGVPLPSYLLDDEMKIRCQSTDGNPLATLNWYRGNSKINGLSSSTTDDTVTKDYTWNLNRNDNDAVYTCKATNDALTTPLTCQLGPVNVYFPAESVALSGITNPVKEGETKILTCITSTSNPASQISWLKDNNVWTDNTYESITSNVTRDGDYNGKISEQQMTIFIQAEHNSKSYHCQSSHTDITGHVTSNTIHLTVYYTPLAVNETRNKQSRANEGETGELRCQINSNPTSILKWFRPNGTVLTSNDRITISNSTQGTLHESIITITKTESDDYGNYTCFAESDFANTTFIVIFQGKSRPYPVSGIELSSSHNTINATWIPGFNGGELQSFYVEYWVSPNEEKQLTEETTSNKLTIDGLLPLTEYKIIVVSKNIIGESRSQTQLMITQAEPEPDTDTGKLEDNSSALIGGIVGAIVAIIIVIVILVILILRHKGGNKPSDIELSDNHAKDNTYEFPGVDNPSMDSHDITDTSLPNGNHLGGAIPQAGTAGMYSDIDQPAPVAATPTPAVNLGELYSQVQKKTDNTSPVAMPMYGKVNKDKKPKKDDGVTDVYAQPKKKPKKDDGVTDVYAQPKKKPKKDEEKKKKKAVDKKKNNDDKDKVPDKPKQPEGDMYANLPGSHSGTQDVPPFFTNGQGTDGMAYANLPGTHDATGGQDDAYEDVKTKPKQSDKKKKAVSPRKKPESKAPPKPDNADQPYDDVSHEQNTPTVLPDNTYEVAQKKPERPPKPMAKAVPNDGIVYADLDELDLKKPAKPSIQPKPKPPPPPQEDDVQYAAVDFAMTERLRKS